MQKDKQMCGLSVVIYSMLLSEAIDDVKGTTLYKRSIKQKGNMFQKAIEPYVNQFDDVYDIDATLATNLQVNIDSLVKKMAGRNLADLIMLNQMFDVYSKNPDDWRNLFDIHMQELNT